MERKQKMYKVVLWDIDGTLLNFEAAERAAIFKGFDRLKLGTCTDEMLQRYSQINRSYWERLERGELAKDVILVHRFRDFFAEYGLPLDQAETFNAWYQQDLGDTICFEPYAMEIVKALAPVARQYAVTNGTTVAQEKKLRLSGLGELFEDVFISEKLGFEKPMQGFFDAVMDVLGQVDPSEVLLIGDSLTSDMKGAAVAHFDAGWYNPQGKPLPKDLPITLDLRSLAELFPVFGLPVPKEDEKTDF